MAVGATTRLLHQLRRAALLQPGDGPLDADLLDAFVRHRDELALEILVRRHAPLVLGVCRRLLGNADDAADAFQAVFLVFVRKARGIRRRAALAAWLYGVAYRTSLKARARRQRRQQRETAVARVPEPAVEMDIPTDDVLALLDEEVNALPEKYRAAVVLCELQCRPRREAAQTLNIPEGTVSSRLATARRMLRERLARRGVVLSAAAVALALSGGRVISAPAALLLSTLQAVSAAAAGGLAAGLVSAQVLALQEGVLKAMFLSKLKLVTGLLVAVGLVGGGIALRVSSASGQDASALRQTSAARVLLPQQSAADAGAPAKSRQEQGQQPPPKKEPEADGRTLSEWTRLLLTGDVIERQGAVMALGKIGPEAAPVLALAFADREIVNVRLWAAWHLGKMGAKARAQIPALEGALQDECGLVRIEAARALWKIDQHRAAVPALCAALKDKDATTRYRAAEVLGELGPGAKGAVPALVEALRDDGVAEFADKSGIGEARPVSWMAGQALKRIDPATARKHGIE
jgi:RNA polymerase sigma factor (sigma-70 family)